jgi:hypothetical protein
MLKKLVPWTSCKTLLCTTHQQDSPAQRLMLRLLTGWAFLVLYQRYIIHIERGQFAGLLWKGSGKHGPVNTGWQKPSPWKTDGADPHNRYLTPKSPA